MFALFRPPGPCSGRAPKGGAQPRGDSPSPDLSRQGRYRALRPFASLIAVALLGSLPWLSTSSLAAEPIGGFSRKPVASIRALTSEELDRLEAWNRAHPDSRLEAERASSLDLHFLKHAAGGREFLDRGLFGHSPRFPTALVYEEAARALAAGRADGRKIRRFRRPDGATVTVETTSGSVVIVAPTGRIKTFFNAAARCSGREPAVRCKVSLHRVARWVRRRTGGGRLIEIDYSADPLAEAQPLAPLPSSVRPPSPD